MLHDLFLKGLLTSLDKHAFFWLRRIYVHGNILATILNVLITPYFDSGARIIQRVTWGNFFTFLGELMSQEEKVEYINHFFSFPVLLLTVMDIFDHDFFCEMEFNWRNFIIVSSKPAFDLLIKKYLNFQALIFLVEHSWYGLYFAINPEFKSAFPIQKTFELLDAKLINYDQLYQLGKLTVFDSSSPGINFFKNIITTFWSEDSIEQFKNGTSTVKEALCNVELILRARGIRYNEKLKKWVAH